MAPLFIVDKSKNNSNVNWWMVKRCGVFMQRNTNQKQQQNSAACLNIGNTWNVILRTLV